MIILLLLTVSNSKTLIIRIENAMKKRHIHHILFLLMLTITSSAWGKQRQKSVLLGTQATTQRKNTRKNGNSPEKEVWITIFTHGILTHMLRRFNLELARDLINDDVEGTMYARATKHIRENRFFRINQAIQGLGLRKINKKNIKPGNTATALAVIFDYIDKLLNKRDPKFNYYYTYGWSGIISKSLRRKEAKKMYAALTKEIQKFHNRGINPKVRIIGYSHGGNIALHLALPHKKNTTSTMIIDELILLGTPIHNGFDYLTKSPLFKKIYNIYSYADYMQALDLLASGSFFSRRTFVNRKHFQVPEKIKQIRLKMVRNRTTKKSWPKEKDPRYKFDKPLILSGNSKLLRKISPGHVELWFFGWVSKYYRKRFPLKPMPIVAILPAILHAIEHFDHGASKHYVVDLRPDQKMMIIKKKGSHTVRPILPKGKLAQLYNLTKKFAVKKRTVKEMNRQIKRAIKQARQERKISSLVKSKNSS